MTIILVFKLCPQLLVSFYHFRLRLRFCVVDIIDLNWSWQSNTAWLDLNSQEPLFLQILFLILIELHLNPEIASEREYKGISIGVLKTKAELKKWMNKKYGNTQHNWITPWIVWRQIWISCFFEVFGLDWSCRGLCLLHLSFCIFKVNVFSGLEVYVFFAFSKWIIFNVEVDTVSLTLWPCCQKVASNFNGFGFNCNRVANNVQCHTFIFL